MTPRVLTGLTDANCKSGYLGAGDLWHAQFMLVAWRFDDGPIEEGRLRVHSAGITRSELSHILAVVPNQALLRVQVREVDEGRAHERWELVNILDPAPTNDQGLLDLVEARNFASPALHPSDLAKVVSTALVRGGDGVFCRARKAIRRGAWPALRTPAR